MILSPSNHFLNKYPYLTNSYRFLHSVICKPITTLRPSKNGCQFPDGIFKSIYQYENIYILITISPKFVPKGPIDNIPALRIGSGNVSSETMMASLLTHICVTRPRWIPPNTFMHIYIYIWIWQNISMPYFFALFSIQNGAYFFVKYPCIILFYRHNLCHFDSMVSHIWNKSM